MKWLALVLLPFPALAQQVENPRPYGWWLGDELVQRIRIKGQVDPSSLPRPRAVDYWLDLRDVARRDLPGGTELTLRWQNFYSALEPRERQVPASAIRHVASHRRVSSRSKLSASSSRICGATSSPARSCSKMGRCTTPRGWCSPS